MGSSQVLGSLSRCHQGDICDVMFVLVDVSSNLSNVELVLGVMVWFFPKILVINTTIFIMILQYCS